MWLTGCKVTGHHRDSVALSLSFFFSQTCLWPLLPGECCITLTTLKTCWLSTALELCYSIYGHRAGPYLHCMRLTLCLCRSLAFCTGFVHFYFRATCVATAPYTAHIHFRLAYSFFFHLYDYYMKPSFHLLPWLHKSFPTNLLVSGSTPIYSTTPPYYHTYI